jgi:predicted permease
VPSGIADFLLDARQALRLLLTRPGFAAAAILTLALGIGAPTAVFSIVHAVLLRPLPYAAPERLVQAHMESTTPRGVVRMDALPVSAAGEWAASTTTLDGLAIYNETARTASTSAGPERLTGIATTANLFDLLGTAPTLGRVFSEGDDDLLQVVLSDTAWRTHFHADSGVVGTTVTLDGQPYRVTGLMPERFHFPTPETAFWIPVRLDTGGSRGMLLPVIARVRAGVPLAAAVDEGLIHIGADNSGFESRLLLPTLQESMVGPVSRTLWLFMAAVSLVAVVATVNIALLLVVRGTSREGEFALRSALGADRGRLVRQLVGESAVLTALGGVAGFSLAYLIVTALRAMAPPEIPRLDEAGLDAGTLGFAVGMMTLAVLTFSVLSAAPVLRGSRERARMAAHSRRRLLTLASVETALALVLLVAASLLLESFVRQVAVDQGFDHRDRLALQFTMPRARYPTPEARMAFVERVLERVRGLPGVTHAAVITAMPNRQPTGRFAFDPIGIDPFAPPGSHTLGEVRMVTDGGLAALGVPLLGGRDIRADDTNSSEPVVVISAASAAQHFPGVDPVGRTLFTGSGPLRVIGVAGDVRPAVTGLPQHDPSVYLPLRQSLDVFQQFATVTLAVHAPSAAAPRPAIRHALLDLDPDMAPFNVRALSDEVARLVAGPRFSATVVSLFSLVAFVMAAVGVYGVVAYQAARRTKDIGVRLALGATRGRVTRVVLSDGLFIVAAGIGVGAPLAVWLARLLQATFDDLSTRPLVTVVTVSLTLAATALAAAYIPARRAARISVLAALRED